MNENRKQSLLDLLAESAGCSCLSDLRSIKPKARIQLIKALEKILPDAYSPYIWNDALVYLISAPPQISPEAAHKLLIDHYRNQEEIPLSEVPQGGNDYESE